MVKPTAPIQGGMTMANGSEVMPDGTVKMRSGAEITNAVGVVPASTASSRNSLAPFAFRRAAARRFMAR